MDIRHKRRIKLLEELFSLSFSKTDLSEEAGKILEKQSEIDEMIQKFAPRYPIDKLSKIDLSILRLAIYELVYYKKNPAKVVIDEAVILAREYGNEKSYSFVNGVLGSVLKNINGLTG